MAKEKIVGFKLYRHYLWFAIAGGLVIPAAFVAISIGSFTGMWLMGSWIINLIAGFNFLILASAIIHASIWSVFGDRGIVKRTLVSLGFVLILVLGTSVGLFFLVMSTAGVTGQLMMLLAFPLIVAAQVPFWVLRCGLGWQLVREDEQPVATSLKQLFLITLVFGVASAVPSIAGNVYASDAAANNLAVGSIHYAHEVLEDGSYEYNEIEVTPENRQQLLLKEIRQVKTQINQATAYSAVVLAIFSFVSIPVFWFIFRLGKRKALLYSGLYGALLYCLAILGFVPFYGFRYFWFQISPFYIFGIALYLFLVIAPLLISRSKGFWLSTGRVIPAEVEPPLEPVVDPLA